MYNQTNLNWPQKHRSYEAAHLIWTLGGPLDEAMDVAQSAALESHFNVVYLPPKLDT